MTSNLTSLLLLLLLLALTSCATQSSVEDTPEETSQFTQLSTATRPNSAVSDAQETLNPDFIPTATAADETSDTGDSDGIESFPTDMATVATSGQPTQTPSINTGDTLLFLVPQVELSDPENPLSAPIVIGYEERRIRAGETWVVEPDPFGARFVQTVGALRLQLVAVRENLVVVNLLADQWADGAFYPRAEPERYTITDGTCLTGYPLVLDALYGYCFELAQSGGELRMSYYLDSQSTIPPVP
jgi:hypothetical protein